MNADIDNSNWDNSAPPGNVRRVRESATRGPQIHQTIACKLEHQISLTEERTNDIMRMVDRLISTRPRPGALEARGFSQVDAIGPKLILRLEEVNSRLGKIERALVDFVG